MTYSCASSSPNQYGLAKTSTLASMFTSTVGKLQLKGHLKGPKALLKNPTTQVLASFRVNSVTLKGHLEGLKMQNMYHHSPKMHKKHQHPVSKNATQKIKIISLECLCIFASNMHIYIFSFLFSILYCLSFCLLYLTLKFRKWKGIEKWNNKRDLIGWEDWKLER